MFIFQVNPAQELRDKIDAYLKGCENLLSDTQKIVSNLETTEKNMKTTGLDSVNFQKWGNLNNLYISQLCSNEPSSINQRMKKTIGDEHAEHDAYDDLFETYSRIFDKANENTRKEINVIWRDFEGADNKPGTRDAFIDKWNTFANSFNDRHKSSGITIGTVSEGKTNAETKIVLAPTGNKNWLEENRWYDNIPLYGPARDVVKGAMIPFYPELNPDPTIRWTKAVSLALTGAAFLTADMVMFWKGGSGATPLIRQEAATTGRLTIRNAWKWADRLVTRYFGEETTELVVRNEVKETTEEVVKKGTNKAVKKTTDKVVKKITEENFDIDGKLLGKKIVTEEGPQNILRTKGKDIINLSKDGANVVSKTVKKVPGFFEDISNTGNSLINTARMEKNPVRSFAYSNFALPFKTLEGGVKLGAGTLCQIANAELLPLINNIYLRNLSKEVGYKIVIPSLSDNKSQSNITMNNKTQFTIDISKSSSETKSDSASNNKNMGDVTDKLLNIAWWNGVKGKVSVQSGKELEFFKLMENYDNEKQKKALDNLNTIINKNNIKTGDLYQNFQKALEQINDVPALFSAKSEGQKKQYA